MENKKNILRRLPSVSGIGRRKLTRVIISKLVNKQEDIFNVLDVGSGINNWKQSFDGEWLGKYDTLELKEDLLPTYQGDFFSMNFDSKYTFIIATEFIEHIPDPKLFFQKTRDSIKIDGRLIISFPFFFKIHGDPDDYFRYTLSGIKSLVEGLFEIETVYSHGGKYQVAWEAFTDGKLFYPLRIFNFLIASTKPHKSAFPLGYVIALKPIS